MADPKNDLMAAFKADVQDAVSFIESDIGPARAAATRFYNAEPFGDEEEGRSQIVTPVVRDTVRATLPSLMRVFFGGQRVVEFTGSNGLSAEIADEMTEAVHHVFMRQNPGFEICWAAFKDALVRKVGWIMWWWDETIEVKSRIFTDVLEDQLAAMDAELDKDEQLEVMSGEEVGITPEQPPQIDPATGIVVAPGMPAQPIIAYKVRLISKKKRKQAKIAAVPPEEIIVSRDAVSIYDARLIGRRREITVGDARAMGISDDLIDEAGGGFDSLSMNEEKLARDPSQVIGTELSHSTPDQRKLLYVEACYRVDADGDGISELRKICTLGSNFIEVMNEYTDEVNLAAFCPDPEPHTVWGLSQADNVADLQVIGSHVTRDLLDSLKASIFPRMAYVEGQANVDDVLNTEIGGAIRMRSLGAVTPLAVPFLGQQAFPVIEWLDQQRESRTGLSKNAQGLDPRALQSTNQVAVAASVTASQAQVELIARIFAESGMTRMFRGIAKLLIENNSSEFKLPIHGELKPVNPAKWSLDAEMSVDTGLGVGSNDQKIAVLQGVANAQAEVLEKMGLENPLVSLEQFYNTQKQKLAYSGFRDIHRYWMNPRESMKNMEPTPPTPTPEQVLAEAEMKIKAGEQDIKRLELVLEDDRERDKNEADVMLKAAELNLKYRTQIDVAAIKAAMDRKRIESQAARSAGSR